ncbi:hypothetical protein ONZ45_g17026 [Pleurotus djamor]|nr:hypothetical protein ONZ45_g17026 [Pleurotus djamor]
MSPHASSPYGLDNSSNSTGHRGWGSERSLMHAIQGCFSLPKFELPLRIRDGFEERKGGGEEEDDVDMGSLAVVEEGEDGKHEGEGVGRDEEEEDADNGSLEATNSDPLRVSQLTEKAKVNRLRSR